ncbi:MAG: MurR/RpiR family transcriptional regulator [Longicatena sp.]
MIPILEKAQRLPLTSIEQDILSFFKNHTSSIPYMNLIDISKPLYISNATVVRFCKKLNIAGFNEFKYVVNKELKDLNTINQLDYQMIIEHPLALFKDNIDSLDFDDVEKVIDILCSNIPLYIHGRSLSFIAAQYLQCNLTSLDRPCILINGLHLLRSISSNLSVKSAIVIISAHGEYDIYSEPILNAKKSNAFIILITSNQKSSLIKLCDIILYSSDKNEVYNNIDINSRLGVLTITQILIELTHLQYSPLDGIIHF